MEKRNRFLKIFFWSREFPSETDYLDPFDFQKQHKCFPLCMTTSVLFDGCPRSRPCRSCLTLESIFSIIFPWTKSKITLHFSARHKATKELRLQFWWSSKALPLVAANTLLTQSGSLKSPLFAAGNRKWRAKIM